MSTNREVRNYIPPTVTVMSVAGTEGGSDTRVDVGDVAGADPTGFDDGPAS